MINPSLSLCDHTSIDHRVQSYVFESLFANHLEKILFEIRLNSKSLGDLEQYVLL